MAMGTYSPSQTILTPTNPNFGGHNGIRGFSGDERNLGGRKLILDNFQRHRDALSAVKSHVSEQRKRPRAHIDYSIGGKRFGQHKGHLKIYKASKQPILIRPRHNINPELHARTEFQEVNECRARANSVKSAINNKAPLNYKQNKRLLAGSLKRNECHSFQLTEHAQNLASLQRRLNQIGDIKERQKNPFDPIAYPSLFFRRQGQKDKKTSIIGFQKRILKK